MWNYTFFRFLDTSCYVSLWFICIYFCDFLHDSSIWFLFHDSSICSCDCFTWLIDFHVRLFQIFLHDSFISMFYLLHFLMFVCFCSYDSFVFHIHFHVILFCTKWIHFHMWFFEHDLFIFMIHFWLLVISQTISLFLRDSFTWFIYLYDICFRMFFSTIYFHIFNLIALFSCDFFHDSFMIACDFSHHLFIFTCDSFTWFIYLYMTHLFSRFLTSFIYFHIQLFPPHHFCFLRFINFYMWFLRHMIHLFPHVICCHIILSHDSLFSYVIFTNDSFTIKEYSHVLVFPWIHFTEFTSFT